MSAQRPTPTITIGDHTFAVELATTSLQQEKGLSYHSSLPQNAGMLFVFEEPAIRTFWMKDMKFPIDIIFIRNNRIINIHENIWPPSPNTPVSDLSRYSSSEPANYVLEINAGLSQKYGFRNGDSVVTKGL